MQRDEFERSLAEISLSDPGIGYGDVLGRLRDAGFRSATGRSTTVLALATAAVWLVVWWAHASVASRNAERGPAVPATAAESVRRSGWHVSSAGWPTTVAEYRRASDDLLAGCAAAARPGGDPRTSDGSERRSSSPGGSVGRSGHA